MGVWRSGLPIFAEVNMNGKDWRITTALVIVCILTSCAAPADEEIFRLYVRASEAYALGRFVETAEMLVGVKKFPPALVLRGKAEYFSGELDMAEKSFRLAIKFRPPAFEARLYLARILREKGEMTGASMIVESLLADNPQDIRSLRLAAELAEETGKGEEAAALIDKAAELSAECAMVLLERARMRWVAGKGHEALEDLGRARAMLLWDTPLAQSIRHLEIRIGETL